MEPIRDKIDKMDLYDENSVIITDTEITEEVSEDPFLPSSDQGQDIMERSEDYLDRLDNLVKSALTSVSGDNEKFDKFKIPGSLTKCKQYWDSTKLGVKPIKAIKPINSTTTNLKTKDKTIVLNSLKNQKKWKNTIFQNPLKLQPSGISIQIYYLYILFCLIMTSLTMVTFCLPGLEYRRLYCDMIKNEKGPKSCSLFDLTSYQVLSYTILFKDDLKTEFQSYLAQTEWVQIICTFVIYMTVIVFYRLQVNIRLDYYLERRTGSASEFTVMIDQVDAREPIDPIHQFIGSTNQACGFPMPYIMAVSRAQADALLKLTEKEIVDKKIQFEVMKNKMDSIEAQEERDAKSSEIGIYKKFLKEINSDLFKLEEKFQKLQNSQADLRSKEKCSAIFLTFNTNFQREQALASFRNMYPRGRNVCDFIFFCLCCRKKPRYRLRKAPEPKNINWENIGYSRNERIWRKILARSFLALMFPVIIFIYIALNVIELYQIEESKQSLFSVIFVQIFNYCVISAFKYGTDKAIDALEGFEKKLKRTDYLARKTFISACLKYCYVLFGNFCVAFTEMVISDKINLPKNQQVDYAVAYTGNKFVIYMITSLYLRPLITYFHPKFVIATFYRWRISKAFKMAKNDQDGSKKPSKFLCMTQGMLTKYYDRPEPKLEKKYSLAYFMMLVLALSTMFAPLLIPPLIFLILVINSVIEIGLFSERYKPPIRDTKNLSDSVFRRMILVPKLITYFYPVVYGTARNKLNNPWIGLIFLANGIMILCNFEAIFSRMKRNIERKHISRNFKYCKVYERCKKGFGTDYEKENPSPRSLDFRVMERNMMGIQHQQQHNVGVSHMGESRGVQGLSSLGDVTLNKNNYS